MEECKFGTPRKISWRKDHIRCVFLFRSIVSITHPKFMKNYSLKMFRCMRRANARYLPGIMILALCRLAWPSHASVLLDDTWADGTRTDQILPTESAWFAASASSLTATP